MLTYVYFGTDNLERAKRFYDAAAALAHGGSCEGAPGLRLHYAPDFYAAYVRDPDGNKVAAVCRGFAPTS